MRIYSISGLAILCTIAANNLAFGATAVFDFEDFIPTSNGDVPVPNGDLAYIQLVEQGLALDITRPGSVFDVQEYRDDSLPSSLGNVGLSSFADEQSSTPFVLNFSQPVTSVQVTGWDYGQDTPDTLRLSAFRQPDAFGLPFSTRSRTIPTNELNDIEPNFASVSVSQTIGAEINSVSLIGGTSEFPHSLFYDNIIVEFEPASGTPIAAPTSSGYLGRERRLTGDVDASGSFEFDPDKPVVVVTHGWQPAAVPVVGRRYTGEIDSSEFSGDMYNSIKSEFGDEVNVVVYAWEEAYVGFVDGLGNDIDDNELPAILPELGVDLANKLTDLLGDNFSASTGYPENIHFVGHSYGTKINFVASEMLNNNGYGVEHITVLDAPTDNGIITGQLDIKEYERFTFEAIADETYVENYFGTDFIPPSAYGSRILNAVSDGGYRVRGNHGEVAEEYVETVPGQGGSNRISGSEGFVLSAALSELGGDWIDRPFNPTTIVPDEFADDFLIASIAGEHAALSFNRNSRSTLDIRTASDGFSAFDALIPETADFLAFDLSFPLSGDGDWLEISFGDDLLYQINGLVAQDNLLSTYLSISEYAGQSDVLSFLLSSHGDLPASVRLENVRWVSYEANVTPVPVPASAGLLLGALVLLGLGRKKAS